MDASDQPDANAIPNPEFMAKFEKALHFWSDSVTTGNREDAEATSAEIMKMVVEEQAKNPDPDVQMMDAAEALERQGDWAGAEALRRKVLSSKESSGNFGMVAKAQMDLSITLRKAGRLDEAWKYAEVATVTGRGFQKTFVFQAMTLLNQATCALVRKDFGTALTVANDAVEIVEPGKLYDLMRAKTLTMRARCHLANGQLPSAEADLNAAWQLLAPHDDTTRLAGVIASIANWREVKSLLQIQRKDR